MNRFAEQLHFYKQSAIGKLKHAQAKNHESAEKGSDLYIKQTLENVSKIALLIFKEFLYINPPASHEADSALITGCDRFLGIISNDRMPGFKNDLDRYSLNNQAKTKLAKLPHAYILLAVPVLLGNSRPSDGTIDGLRDVAIKQLSDNISAMKYSYPIAYNVKAVYSGSDETALKSIETLTFPADGQTRLDAFITDINNIARIRMEKHIEKADTDIQLSLPVS